MNTKNKPSLVYTCDDDTFNFFLDHENKEIYLNENMSPDFVLFFDKLLKENYKVIYHLSVEKYPYRGSDLSKNGTDRFYLNKVREIRKQ